MPLITEIEKKTPRGRLKLTVISGFLWLGILIHFVPIWWAFTSSIKPWWEIYVFPPPFFPKDPTWLPYKTILGGLSTRWQAGGWAQLSLQPLWVYLRNTLLMTAGVMGLQLPVTAFIAYSLSKLCPHRWRRFMFLFFVGTMFVPFQAALIPRFLMLRNFPFASRFTPDIPFTSISFPSINLLNSYWAVILPGAYSAWNMLLFKGYFDVIPDELIDAARIDGASEFMIFWRIVAPMSIPAFGVVAYYCFNGVWNDYLWPSVVFTNAPHLEPLSVGLFRLQQAVMAMVPTPATEEYLAAGLGINAVMAMGIIQSLPMIAVFIILREYIMKGVRLSGFR